MPGHDARREEDGPAALAQLPDGSFLSMLAGFKVELKRLRREVGQVAAEGRIQGDPGPGDAARTFTREELAEA